MAPSSQDCTVTVTSGSIGAVQHLVVTDAGTWVDMDGTGLVAVDPGDGRVLGLEPICPSSPTFWAGLGGLPSGTGPVEDIDGVPSTRLEPTDAAFLGAAFMPAGLTLDGATVWVAEAGGWISALDFQVGGDAAAFGDGFGFPPAGVDGHFVETMTLRLRSVGDPDVTVVGPG